MDLPTGEVESDFIRQKKLFAAVNYNEMKNYIVEPLKKLVRVPYQSPRPIVSDTEDVIIVDNPQRGREDDRRRDRVRHSTQQRRHRSRGHNERQNRQRDRQAEYMGESSRQEAQQPSSNQRQPRPSNYMAALYSMYPTSHLNESQLRRLRGPEPESEDDQNNYH